MDSNSEYGVNDKYDKFDKYDKYNKFDKYDKYNKFDKFDDVFYIQKLFKYVMNAFAHPLTEYGVDFIKSANNAKYAGHGDSDNDWDNKIGDDGIAKTGDREYNGGVEDCNSTGGAGGVEDCDSVCNTDDGCARAGVNTAAAGGAGMYIGAICRVFFDHAVSFYAYGEGGGAFAAEISETTYAKLANLDEADYVVVMDAAGFDQWNKVYQGSLVNPHAGATVIVAVPRIAGDISIEAEGPGIDGRAAFYIDSVIADCLNRVAALDIEYPKGFELLFVSRSGSLFAVPRHVKIYSGKIQ